MAIRQIRRLNITFQSVTTGATNQDHENFLVDISESTEQNRAQINRVANELDRATRMLDILDEMLAIQDYTITDGNFYTRIDDAIFG